jgi:hypothetical protein
MDKEREAEGEKTCVHTEMKRILYWLVSNVQFDNNNNFFFFFGGSSTQFSIYIKKVFSCMGIYLGLNLKL